MDFFINVNEKDPKVQRKIKVISDKYNGLPFNYQSKIGYDTLAQNVILEKKINLMSATTVDIDIDLKKKISTNKNLESRLLKIILI